MNARPPLNKAYIMIGVVAIMMLAMLLGSIALRLRWHSRIQESSAAPLSQRNSATATPDGTLSPKP